MKFNKLLLSLVLSLIIALTLVSATVDVNFYAYNSTIQDDGTLTTTTQNVTGYSSVGYVCTSADCSTIGAQVAGFTSTTATNMITVTFPTNLQNASGYVIYFYKPGYIGWQQAGIILNGTDGGTPINAPVPVYFAKMNSGSAPIMNLSVVDQTLPNLPISVSASVTVDSDVYSAINDTRIAPIPLSEDVQTQVILTITNSTGSVVYTTSQTVNVPYNGSSDVTFTYPGFSSTGSYSVSVTTNVTDAKILNPTTETTTSGITVIPFGLTNYSYSLLQNLQMSPLNPDEGDTVNFDISSISGFVNDSGSLSSLGTTLQIEYLRNGLFFDRVTYNLANSTNYTTFSWSRTFSQDGSYTVTVTATPISPLGNQTLTATQQISFSVEDSTTSITEDDDDDNEDDDDELEKLTLKLAGSTGESDSGAIDLTNKDKMSGIEKFLWTLFWLIILLIIIILFVLFAKYWFWVLLGLLVLILLIIGIVKLSWLLTAFLIALTILIISYLIKLFI